MGGVELVMEIVRREVERVREKDGNNWREVARILMMLLTKNRNPFDKGVICVFDSDRPYCVSRDGSDDDTDSFDHDTDSSKNDYHFLRSAEELFKQQFSDLDHFMIGEDTYYVVRPPSGKATADKRLLWGFFKSFEREGRVVVLKTRHTLQIWYFSDYHGGNAEFFVQEVIEQVDDYLTKVDC